MGGRFGRQGLGALQQAQTGADDLAGCLVAAGGDEAFDKAAQFRRQGDMTAVLGWHGAHLVVSAEGVTFRSPGNVHEVEACGNPATSRLASGHREGGSAVQEG